MDTSKVGVVHKEYNHTEHPDGLRKADHGVVLIPQPSNDPRDPLNWPMWKKVTQMAIVSFVAFISLAQQLANEAGFFPQAALYHKTPTEISYSVSAL
jgi:hypothetical protein